MEKFLKKLSIYLLFPVLIISVNYLGDPANLFHEDYELSIAKNLMKGYNVTNVYNHNERLLQKKLIQNIPDCPQVIALGSSRGMILNADISQSPSFFNNSMSGSVLEDKISIYELYERRGCPIKRVIISLDPWILNDNHGEKRWKTLEPEYNSLLSKLYKKREFNGLLFLSNYENYKQLLSFSYFKSAVRYLVKGIGRNDARATRLAENNGLTRITDGSVTWDAQYRDAPQAVVDRRAHDIISTDPMEYLGRFDHLSGHYKKLLEDFVSYLQSKQIKVEFLLTPFHPVVYSNFLRKGDYRNVLASEVFFKRLAKKRGIEIYGSFDPHKTNLVSSDFYDGLHCTANGLVKIMNTRMINRSKSIKKEIL